MDRAGLFRYSQARPPRSCNNRPSVPTVDSVCAVHSVPLYLCRSFSAPLSVTATGRSNRSNVHTYAQNPVNATVTPSAAVKVTEISNQVWITHYPNFATKILPGTTNKSHNFCCYLPPPPSPVDRRGRPLPLLPHALAVPAPTPLRRQPSRRHRSRRLAAWTLHAAAVPRRRRRSHAAVPSLLRHRLLNRPVPDPPSASASISAPIHLCSNSPRGVAARRRGGASTAAVTGHISSRVIRAQPPRRSGGGGSRGSSTTATGAPAPASWRRRRSSRPVRLHRPRSYEPLFREAGRAGDALAARARLGKRRRGRRYRRLRRRRHRGRLRYRRRRRGGVVVPPRRFPTAARPSPRTPQARRSVARRHPTLPALLF